MIEVPYSQPPKADKSLTPTKCITLIVMPKKLICVCEKLATSRKKIYRKNKKGLEMYPNNFRVYK